MGINVALCRTFHLSLMIVSQIIRFVFFVAVLSECVGKNLSTKIFFLRIFLNNFYFRSNIRFKISLIL